ncbi:hypothetical protein BC629DRAFT_1512531 [Irpex lacteus]|nr:hypothetical protein BC629DRAFT_1512531 [Irpex lacteus]
MTSIHTNADYPNFYLHGTVVPQVVYSRVSAPYPLFPSILFSEGQLPDRDSRPTTTMTSTKIKLRIMWPGYGEFSRDINAKEHTKTGESIPKWKLAFCVAQTVHAFYTSGAVSTNAGVWDIRNIRFEYLQLLELRQVSTGSWQPVLVYCLS